MARTDLNSTQQADDAQQSHDWAEDDDGLPPRKEYFDADGLKHIEEWSVNVEGYAVKTTKVVRVTKTTKKVSRAVASRTHWKKFGIAAERGSDVGITAVNIDDIPVEWTSGPGTSSMYDGGADDDGEFDAEADEESISRQADVDIRKRLAMERFKRRIEERKAGVDNWAQLMAIQAGADVEAVKGAAAAGDAVGAAGAAAAAAGAGLGATDPGGKPGKYIPPSMRGKTPAELAAVDPYQRDDSATVRVSNVSPNTTEADLALLFRPFGPIKRLFLSRDRVTGESKGFAFVAFANVADAKRCIEKLDGFGYDHLILRVEWSKPNPRDQPGTSQRR